MYQCFLEPNNSINNKRWTCLRGPSSTIVPSYIHLPSEEVPANNYERGSNWGKVRSTDTNLHYHHSCNAKSYNIFHFRYEFRV